MSDFLSNKTDTVVIHFWDTQEDYECAVRTDDILKSGATVRDAVEKLQQQYENDAVFAGEVLFYTDDKQEEEVLVYRFETDDAGNVDEEFPFIDELQNNSIYIALNKAHDKEITEVELLHFMQTENISKKEILDFIEEIPFAEKRNALKSRIDLLEIPKVNIKEETSSVYKIPTSQKKTNKNKR